MVDSMRIANHWDLWYPTSYDGKTTTDTWKESLKELKDYYVNSFEEGEIWMQSVLPYLKPPTSAFLPINLEIEVECNGEMIKVNLNKQVNEWRGDGTLDAFFNMT